VADFTPGDVVVLKSGSMRMLVERMTEDGDVAVIWANEGQIGRDTLPAFALNKWEERKWEDRPQRDDRPARPWTPRPPRDDAGEGGGDSRPPRPFGAKPGGKPPFKKPFGKPFGGGDRAGGPKPWGDKPARTGMDGKPKTKNFYRKDD
jgi:uncharacterized protein YodC (DUF2158 family)